MNEEKNEYPIVKLVREICDQYEDLITDEVSRDTTLSQFGRHFKYIGPQNVVASFEEEYGEFKNQILDLCVERKGRLDALRR